MDPLRRTYSSQAIIADGSYDQVLTKWNVSLGALKTAAINGGS